MPRRPARGAGLRYGYTGDQLLGQSTPAGNRDIAQMREKRLDQLREIRQLKAMAAKRPPPEMPIRKAAVQPAASPEIQLEVVLNDVGSLDNDALALAYHMAGEQQANDVRLAAITELMRRGVMG